MYFDEHTSGWLCRLHFRYFVSIILTSLSEKAWNRDIVYWYKKLVGYVTFLARGEKEMDDSPILDGYRFEYVPVIDGLENAFTIYTRATTEYDPDREMSEFAEQPVIQIDVDSTGITAVRFGKLYEVGTTMSDETTLITFDAANESVKNAVENTLESYSEINRIKFEYITVQYDKQYVNIPAWVYYVKTGTSETIAVIACNALDGSIIYFEPTLDRYLWYF